MLVELFSNWWGEGASTDAKIPISFTISCMNLINKDVGVGGQSDPICVLFASNDSSPETEIGRTEFQLNNPNPRFQKKITFKFLPSSGNQNLVFKLYDVDYMKGSEALLTEDNFLGSFSTTLEDILADEDNLITGNLLEQSSIVINASYDCGKPKKATPPGPPPPPREPRVHERSNVLISRGLPPKFIENCRSSLSPIVADIAEELYERRGMMDCTQVPEKPTVEAWEESWHGFQASRDPKGEALVKSLISELDRLKMKFTDPHFPPDNSSLFADPERAFAHADAKQTFRKDQDPFLAGVKGIEWKRPAEIGNPSAKPVVFSGTISPDDVAQGRLGNCYFMAAISSCASGDDDILLKDLIVEDGMEQGVFGVKFFVAGKWTTVIVDDLFPCILSRGRWTPIFASPRVNEGDPRNEKELWSLIMEKAWAKLHLSYEATAGGQSSDAHNYLTGGSCSHVTVGSTPDKEWAKLVELADPSNFAFLSTFVRDGMGKNGLVEGHAYSILGVKEASVGKMVQVRNPWASAEWTGDYGRGSSKWSAGLKKELMEDSEEDGSFWMTWADFYRHYETVDVCDPRKLCKMYDDNIARVDGVSAQWVAGISAGGRPAHPTFKFNPKFELCVQGSEVELSLYQPDVRYMDKVKEVPWIDCYLFLLAPGQRPAQAKEALRLEQDRQASARVAVVAGTTYTLVACAWGPGVQSAFSITACGHDCTLRPLPAEAPPADMAAKMALQESRASLCCFSSKPLEGSYYEVPEGKLRPEFLAQYRARR